MDILELCMYTHNTQQREIERLLEHTFSSFILYPDSGSQCASQTGPVGVPSFFMVLWLPGHKGREGRNDKQGFVLLVL